MKFRVKRAYFYLLYQDFADQACKSANAWKVIFPLLFYLIGLTQDSLSTGYLKESTQRLKELNSGPVGLYPTLLYTGPPQRPS